MTARAWLLFALCSAVWGVPYLFIKVAVDAGVPPAFVAWARIALAALLLVPMAVHRGALRGLRGRAGAIAAYAACEIAVPFVLIATGERYISSSLTAILIATMPLLVALLSVRLSPADRPTGVGLVGLVIGLSGVVALLGVDVAASLALSTVALSPAAFLTPPHAWPSPAAFGAIAVLGVVCTAWGLIAFFQLIAEAGPSRASVVTYVNPLVAVAAGVLALGERLGVMSLVGLLLILAGSWLATARAPSVGDMSRN